MQHTTLESWLVRPILPPVLGGEMPVAGTTGGAPDGGTQPADGGAPGSIGPDGGGAPAEEFVSLPGGEVASWNDVQRWRERDGNWQSWEAKQKQRDQRLASADRVLKQLEASYGPVDQWDNRVENDAAVWRLLNTRIQTEPGFYESLEKFFQERNEARGMSPGQAARTAEAQARAVADGKPPATGPAGIQDDPRIARLERSISNLTDAIKARDAREAATQTERINTVVQSSIQQSINDSLTRYGANLSPNMRAKIQRWVVADMRDEEITEGQPRFTDAQLIQMARDGSLGPEIARRIQIYMRELDNEFTARQTAIATARTTATSRAKPTPARSGGGSAPAKDQTFRRGRSDELWDRGKQRIESM